MIADNKYFQQIHSINHWQSLKKIKRRAIFKFTLLSECIWWFIESLSAYQILATSYLPPWLKVWFFFHVSFLGSLKLDIHSFPINLTMVVAYTFLNLCYKLWRSRVSIVWPLHKVFVFFEFERKINENNKCFTWP